MHVSASIVSSNDDEDGNVSEQGDESVSSIDDTNVATEDSSADSDDCDDSCTLFSLPNYVLKNENEVWDRFPFASNPRRRRNLANILRQRPGPTRYAVRVFPLRFSSSFDHLC